MYLLGWNALRGCTQHLGGSGHHPWLSFAGLVLCLQGLLGEDTCHLSQPGQGGDDTRQLLAVPIHVLLFSLQGVSSPITHFQASSTLLFKLTLAVLSVSLHF